MIGSAGVIPRRRAGLTSVYVGHGIVEVLLRWDRRVAADTEPTTRPGMLHWLMHVGLSRSSSSRFLHIAATPGGKSADMVGSHRDPGPARQSCPVVPGTDGVPDSWKTRGDSGALNEVGGGRVSNLIHGTACVRALGF